MTSNIETVVGQIRSHSGKTKKRREKVAWGKGFKERYIHISSEARTGLTLIHPRLATHTTGRLKDSLPSHCIPYLPKLQRPPLTFRS